MRPNLTIFQIANLRAAYETSRPSIRAGFRRWCRIDGRAARALARLGYVERAHGLVVLTPEGIARAQTETREFTFSSREMTLLRAALRQVQPGGGITMNELIELQGRLV